MSEGRKKTQRIRDPVHGLIVFGNGTDSHRDETDRIAWKLLDAPEFQRMRRIRQLGFSDLVFPGATHSRFAHSVGVYHIARRLADVIAHRKKHNPDRERVALLAALLHDIGHGPFSHIFESVANSVGLCRKHEYWSAAIVLSQETTVNSVLREAHKDLPEQIGELLHGEGTKDIYSAIVSSQFDADRLDYIQRDRQMTGVAFGHIDLEWLLDCLEVGEITIGRDDPSRAPCLYLGPKGVEVAEEYLEARSRLYRMVYMHKTTRAAETMLQTLLETVTKYHKEKKIAPREPVLSYLTSEKPMLDSYLALDDSSVWAALAIYSEHPDQHISKLARRLRNRDLYKCLDVGICDKPSGNLFFRFKRKLGESLPAWRNKVIFEDDTITLYTGYNFGEVSALNKVLVKTQDNKNEPEDIASVSDIVKTLRGEQRIQRVYAPGPDEMVKLKKILEEENQ